MENNISNDEQNTSDESALWSNLDASLKIVIYIYATLENNLIIKHKLSSCGKKNVSCVFNFYSPPSIFSVKICYEGFITKTRPILPTAGMIPCPGYYRMANFSVSFIFLFFTQMLSNGNKQHRKNNTVHVRT